MVNHELRNALAAVYGWSEMLVRKRDPATVPRAAFEVMDSAQEAIALINDLLDLSRLDEDRLKPIIKAVEPISIASRSIRRVTPSAELKHVTLQLVSAPKLPNCETDASRVEQILINLLTNAIKYAPERAWFGSASRRATGVSSIESRMKGRACPLVTRSESLTSM